MDGILRKRLCEESNTTINNKTQGVEEEKKTREKNERTGNGNRDEERMEENEGGSDLRMRG